MSSDDEEGRISFIEFRNSHNWKRLMTTKEIRKLVSYIVKQVKNKEIRPDGYPHARLWDVISNFTKRQLSTPWKILNTPEGFVARNTFYKPVEAGDVSKKTFKDNTDIPYDKDGRTNFIVDEAEKNDSFKEEIYDLNSNDPVVITAAEAAKRAKQAVKEAKKIAAQTIVDNFEKKHNEESVEKQIKNTVTKIAKNKELMNLSKEQLRDYLRDAYEISDENALNNMMNAVVAKRAELLANKQLKHEELTEIDISKLQEQSQRDFEKKLQDQNLRYILPAQIEKRERLVQNRLNPELLKSGY